ncbi:MAG: molybdopterin-dependent oxidoreductase [Candidatus Bathyarchaeia archaeon]|nr:molybdopterin-dependent oxidoreductase [Candidatus Bathyarchaeota archaeon]
MKEIILKIDGKEVKGKEGDTILDVCKANGIYIPTLCYLEGLTPYGGCRLCVVEIEGEKKLHTACTYPAKNGLIVKTNTEMLNNYRKKIIELLFAEKNHYCMFCEKSGNCELQELAYKFKLYNLSLPMLNPKLHVDATGKYFAIDHNRCVLCSRCIRACDEIVGLHVLDFSERGNRTFVAADFKDPIGNSSCIECGLCMQVCPTGAIFDKVSSYKFNVNECQKITTVCQQCSIGCPITLFIKDGKILRCEGVDLRNPKVQLCRVGRFDILYRNNIRILTPMIRKNGKLKKCSIEEALTLIIDKINSLTNKKNILCLISGIYPNNILEAFVKFAIETLGSIYVDSTDGYWCRVISQSLRTSPRNVECQIEDIQKADCILIVDVNFKVQNPLHSLVRKAARFNNAKVIFIGSAENHFVNIADIWIKTDSSIENRLLEILLNAINGDEKELKHPKITYEKPEDLHLAANLVNKAKHCIIVYGENLVKLGGTKTVNLIYETARKHDNINVVPLGPYLNSMDAQRFKIVNNLGFTNYNEVELAYLLLGDDDSFILPKFIEPNFLIVQSAYYSKIAMMADLIIPATTWLERDEKVKNLEKPHGIIDEKSFITKLLIKLTGNSLDEQIKREVKK